MSSKSPDPVDCHVGARIRMRRLEQGVSQEKLAEGLGLTFQQVHKYEKGMNRVGASRLALIARLLEVDVGFFFQDAPLAGALAQRDCTMDDFMASHDGLVIARAFVAIPDPKIRRIIAHAIGQIGRALTPKPVILTSAE